MSRRTITLTLILVLAAVLVAAVALFIVNQEAPRTEARKITVGVTISPYAEFVRKVGGDRVDVVVLLPPYADPHTSDLTPSVIKAVSAAKIFFKVGADLEFEAQWLEELAELNPNMLMVDTSAGIELIGSDGHSDPHVWLSPRNTILIVDSIYQGLKQIDPDGAKLYKANRDAYVSELKTLDREVEETLSDLRTRVFVVYHSAWAYFARDYNLKQIALEEEGKEPTVEEMVKVVEAARAEGVKAIFVEPLFDPEQLEVVVKELGVKLISVDTHGFTEYVTHIRGFALALKEALS